MSKWSAHDTTTAASMWTAGVSAAAIAATLRRSRNSVNNKLDRLGLLGVGRTRGTEPPDEPSAAAVRLAQFDPLMARCLAQRAGGPESLDMQDEAA